MCKVAGENQLKPFWKLENVVTIFYKTISNINIVSCNFFANEIHLQFFTLDDKGSKGWKSDHICQFNVNSFSEDFGTGAFKTSSSQSELV